MSECHKSDLDVTSSMSNNQRLPEQLIDELPNPKFIFALVAKGVFGRNYWYEHICHLSPEFGIRIKIKSFSCETFSASTRSEKRQMATQK